MKRLIMAYILLFFCAMPSFAQRNTISAGMTTNSTEIIKTNKEIRVNPNLFLLGEAGLMVGAIDVGHDLLFTVGYRFKERFVAGGGLGYFGAYSAGGTIGFPLYAYGRVDILPNRKISPYVSFYLGGNIPFGVYISPMIGVRLPISQSIKFNISTGCTAASTYSEWGSYVAANWSLRIGVEF